MVAKNKRINNKELDLKISENFKKIIKENYKTVKECSLAGKWGEKYLTNAIGKIKNGKYPTIDQIKKIAELCNCNFIDFFQINKKSPKI